jgi:hypothetical protein
MKAQFVRLVAQASFRGNGGTLARHVLLVCRVHGHLQAVMHIDGQVGMRC